MMIDQNDIIMMNNDEDNFDDKNVKNCDKISLAILSSHVELNN